MAIVWPVEQGEPVVLISPAPHTRLAADAAKFAGKTERGGILLGSRRGIHLHVIEATLPMRWDIASAFMFKRSARGHQEAALKSWKASNHIVDWIGEWHSHPERHPEPSGKDLRTWRRIVEERGARMAFLIVGYEGEWLGVLSPGQSHPVRYQLTETSAAGRAYISMIQVKTKSGSRDRDTMFDCGS